MRDAIVTVRMPREKRKHLEALAKTKGRSLSQQVEYLIDTALSMRNSRPTDKEIQPTPLAGQLSMAEVLTLEDFRSVRDELSKNLNTRGRQFDANRRQ